MSTDEPSINEENKASNKQSSGDEKNIYFIVIIPQEKNKTINKIKFKSEISAEKIYNKNIVKSNGKKLECIVFKSKDKNEKKESESNKYLLSFVIGDYIYDIIFCDKENTFIYETELLKGDKLLDNIAKESIDQNSITLYNKLDLFLRALENNNENNKVDKLFEETIGLYEENKKFGLLISLFVKIYEQNKDFCSKLIETFKNINEDENLDRDIDLVNNLDNFKEIYKNGDIIINKNGYDKINFYGILLCYLSSYDKENFPEIIKNFCKRDGDVLFEILIIYYKHFKEPLKQEPSFYNTFLTYAINKEKEFKLFDRILNFINDLETFLFTINNNIKEIFRKYKEDLRKKPFTLSSDLKLIKKDCEDNKKVIDHIIILIKEIIAFSKDNNILAIYLESTFWVNMLNHYNKSDLGSIKNCYQLRTLFKEYNNLIKELYKDSKKKNELDIKRDINGYNSKDEFTIILDKNVKVQLEGDKYNDEQKLDIIERYNPYYNNRDEDDKKRYKNNRKTDIFDYINFTNSTEGFKKSFHSLDFETMFEENIIEFINKLTSKIKDISTFGTIIEIIDTERIKEKDKIEDYYKILKKKYDSIFKKELRSLKEENKLKKAVEILSYFISILFLYEDNNIFLDDKIGSLDIKIKSLIYNELLKKYTDKKYEKIKEFIYEIYLNKLDDGDNIIKLIDNLLPEEKKKISRKIIEKM